MSSITNYGRVLKQNDSKNGAAFAQTLYSLDQLNPNEPIKLQLKRNEKCGYTQFISIGNKQSQCQIESASYDGLYNFGINLMNGKKTSYY